MAMVRQLELASIHALSANACMHAFVHARKLRSSALGVRFESMNAWRLMDLEAHDTGRRDAASMF